MHENPLASWLARLGREHFDDCQLWIKIRGHVHPCLVFYCWHVGACRAASRL